MPDGTSPATLPPAASWSIDQEARLLGISVRKLFDLMATIKPPVLRAGRRVLFDRIAHEAMQEALRCPRAKPAPEVGRPAFTSSPSPAAPPSTSGALSADAAYSKALELLTQDLPKKPAPSGKRLSTVLPFTGRPRRGAAGPKRSSAT